MICVNCGNDHASLCLDCVMPTEEELASILSDVMFGKPGDWVPVARELLTRLG